MVGAVVVVVGVGFVVVGGVEVVGFVAVVVDADEKRVAKRDLYNG